MPFNFIVTMFWFLFGMTIPFLSGFVTNLITKHNPPASANLNAGLFTSAISYILVVFIPVSPLLCVLMANLLLMAIFPFWWKTDDSKKWFVWGVYVATNTLVNLFAIWLLISLLRS
jgi:hypothetical protein